METSKSKEQRDMTTFLSGIETVTVARPTCEVVLSALGLFAQQGPLSEQGPLSQQGPLSDMSADAKMRKRIPQWLALGIVMSIMTAGWANVGVAQSTLPKAIREAQTVDDLSEEDRSVVEKRVSDLIRQLADDRYAVRQHSMSELQKVGILAFEQLRMATFDPDPQIASSSHYLLLSIRQQWAWESDPVEIKELLANYGVAETIDRASLIDRVAKLGSDAAVSALARISRYETSETLSRQAAIRLMAMAVPEAAEAKQARARIVRQATGVSKRLSGERLKQYAQLLETGVFEKGFWIAAAETEHREVADAGSRSPADRDNAVSLYKWCCQELVQRGQREEALRIATLMVSGNLLSKSYMDLTELSHWAITHGMPEWVESLSKEYPEQFSAFAKLGYALAESWLVQDQTEKANAHARKVLERTASRERAYTNPFLERVSVAKSLLDRSLHEWAEAEYAASLKQADPLQPAAIVVYNEYSELLADGERYEEAAAVWDGLAKRILEEPLFRQQVESTYPELYDGRAADAFVERFYFYSAKHAIKTGQKEKALEHLQNAIRYNPKDSDAWIAKYKLAEDEETKKKVHEETLPLVEFLRKQLSENDGKLHDFAMRRVHAANNNEYAWLISNTGGDLEEALRSAKVACEIAPTNSAFLDTMARIHFLMGDYAKAVEVQEKAVSFEPQDRQMKRILQTYRDQLQDAKGTNR